MEVAFTVEAEMESGRDWAEGTTFNKSLVAPRHVQHLIFDSMQKRLDYLKSRPDETDEAFNITDISVIGGF